MRETRSSRYRSVKDVWRGIGVLLLALAMLAGNAVPTIAQDATPSAGTAVATPAAGTPGATPASGTPRAGGQHVPGLGQSDIGAAVTALMSVQSADGSFAGFDGTADPGTTTDAVVALAAARQAGADAGDAIDRAMTYLRANGEAYAAKGDGQRAKLVLAYEAAGQNGGDVWAPIQSGDYTAGVVGSGSFDLAEVVLAAVAIASDRTSEFADLLAKAQLDDGSWEFGAGQGGDTNTTALAVQALAAAGGATDASIEKALGFLQKGQAADGGYTYTPADNPNDNVPDANSTALVVQAEIAAGVDENTHAFQQDADALGAFQNGSGQFRYTDDQPDDNLFATVQALPAIAGLRLPVQPS